MTTEPTARSTPMEHLSARRKRWLLALGLLRALATTVVLVFLYYVVPLDRAAGRYVFAHLMVGVAVLVGVIIWQVRAIVRSNYPGIRAVQALATTTPLFLLLFASSYLVLSLKDPTMFSEPLTRSDSLYFAVTIFATVGFGDIAAEATTARLVVTIQMILDLVVLGLGVRVIVGAVRKSRATQLGPDA